MAELTSKKKEIMEKISKIIKIHIDYNIKKNYINSNMDSGIDDIMHDKKVMKILNIIINCIVIFKILDDKKMVSILSTDDRELLCFLL